MRKCIALTAHIFLSMARSAISTLTKNAGSCRINVCQPFSLQEFVSSNTPRLDAGQQLHSPSLSSPISRFGSATDVFGEKLSLNLTDSNRRVIKKLAAHAAYDASRGTAITATNVVAFLLLTKFRPGVSLQELTRVSKLLHREVEYKGISFSFSGEMDAVVVYGITLLGEQLVLNNGKLAIKSADLKSSAAYTDKTMVAKSSTSSSDILYRPNLALPFAVELSYYANPLVSVFALESAVALAAIDAFQTDVVALKCLKQESVNVERETILRGALFVAELLQVVLTQSCHWERLFINLHIVVEEN